MPRVYDLDDDDYFPRDSGGKSARRFPVLLFGGIAVVVIVVIWGALFTMRSSRRAAERDAAAFARTVAVKTASNPVSHDGNWPKSIGTWARQTTLLHH
jgi:hypothetical protein